MRTLLKIPLLPIAPFWWLYGFAKRLLYKVGLLKPYKSTLKTIVVGNLSMGGTGKTPFAICIIEFLQGKQISVAYLSRGYGRKTTGLYKVETNSNVENVGDEALLVKLRFPNIDVVVCEDRKTGLQYLEKSSMCQCIVLDDAFQHLRIRADFYFLLSAFHKPYFKDYIFPLGSLREPKIFAKEAQTLVYTKCPENLRAKEISHYQNQSPKAREVLFTSVRYADKIEPVFADNALPISKYTKVLAFAGTASNAQFFKQIASSFSLLKEMAFKDHHNFTEADLQNIARHYRALCQNGYPKNLIILCTEKDAVRLRTHGQRSLLKPLPLYYWPINIYLSKTYQQKLNEIILNLI